MHNLIRMVSMFRFPQKLLRAAFTGPCLLAASIVLSAAEKPGPLPVSSVKADADYDNLFQPEQRGFLGADGALSVPLGDARVLWVFGDTVIGTIRDGKRQGPMVRNSIAIQDMSEGRPGTVEYYWDITDRIPGDFFHPKSFSEPHYFWPGTGVHHDGKVYLFLTRLGDTGEGGAFGFTTIGTTLFRIHNPSAHPDDWEWDQIDLGYGDSHFNINSAAMIEGNFVYLLGYDDGPSDKPEERYSFLARLPVSSLHDEMPGEAVVFLTEGEKWSKEPKNLKRLFSPGMTETTLHYDSVRQKYITVGVVPFQPHLFLVSAEELTGPWSEPQKIYHIDQVEIENYHAYAGRAHAEQTDDPNRLLITYVVNTEDFWSMFNALDIYYPRFIRVQLGEDE